MRFLLIGVALATAVPAMALEKISLPAGSANFASAKASPLGADPLAAKTFGKIGSDAVGAGPGPVPEPASWVMLIAGFGGIGVVLRRRRSLATA